MKTAVLRGLAPLGGRPKAPKGPRPPSREINGYPFTTFTDFPDFLGIMPRVLSDDLVVGRFVAYVSVECFPLFP